MMLHGIFLLQKRDVSQPAEYAEYYGTLTIASQRHPCKSENHINLLINKRALLCAEWARPGGQQGDLRCFDFASLLRSWRNARGEAREHTQVCLLGPDLNEYNEFLFYPRFAVGLVWRSIDFTASQALMIAPSCQPLQNVI